MELILGVSAAILAVLCITLFVRSMELTSSHNELRDQVNTAQRDSKKLKEQLANQNSKFQAKSQEASRSGKSTRDQKQRLTHISDELQQSKSDLEKARTRVRDLSVETDRLRIEREELRTKLANLQSQKEQKTARVVVPEVVATDQAAPAPVAAPPTEEQIARSESMVERDLQRAQEFIERLQERHHGLRQRLVVATADLRLVSRKNEHNRRAYMITQLQLDLAQDELYVIKHGHPPEMPRAEKSKKRASLIPAEETVEVNREAALIELPDVDALEAETEQRLAEERAEREAAAQAQAQALAEAQAEAQAEAEAEAQAEAQALADAVAKEEAEALEAAAQTEASEEISEDEESKQSGTVRRRRATPSQAS